MTNPIVTVTVAQQKAPTPSALQKTGALLSQGATNLAPGAKALLTQLSDLTPLLQAPAALTSVSSSGTTATATLPSTTISSGTYDATTGLVTLTLATALGVAVGDLVEIAAATGTGAFADIDGTWPAAAGTIGDILTFFVTPALTMTITGGNAEATTGLVNGTQFVTTIAGANPSGYNGTVLATVASATTFTYTVPSGLSTPATGSITYTPPNQGELVEMSTTFFAQGGGQSVYVLELGSGTPAQGVTALSAWITANPGVFYSYLVSRTWDNVSSFLTLLATFEALTAKTYFFITTTIATYQNYPATLKCALLFVEAPGVQATEFDAAAAFYVTLNYAPTGTNRLTPLNLAFVFGVTPYPTGGNAALLTELNAANVNYIGTGAAGGISDTILIGGNNADGNPFMYWYSVDWSQINVQLNVNAALINGANNPLNPIVYNQAGINALQQVAVSTMNQGVSAGMVLNPVKATTLDAAEFQAANAAGTYDGYTVVNADPFSSYVTENPNDYGSGIYKGFAIEYVPLRGFESIVFNITVSSFAG